MAHTALVHYISATLQVIISKELRNVKKKMGILESQKPLIVMLLLRFISSGITLFSRAALMEGTSPRVFVAYRQALGFLLIAPIAFLRSREGSSTSSFTLKSFGLIFLASLVGVTVNQNIYFEGLYLASSSMASAMKNILPAITFTIAYIFGLEKINIKSVRSIAKIIGTIVCVTGAVGMVLFKGPELINSSREGDQIWLLGCILLFAANFCWSTWLLLQVPVSKCYPDHVSRTAWMCLLAAMQSGVFAFIIDRDLDAWKIHSGLELGSIAFAAAGSAISLFVQSWVISKRGPLFSAMFSPLTTVIVTFFAYTFAHEEMYIGSLIGAISVIFGLYVVLWGKAKDHILEEDSEEKRKFNQKMLRDEIIDRTTHTEDLEEALLSKQTTLVSDLKDDQKS